MIGGDEEPVERLTPIFETLAPAKDEGWGHVGPSGAGHFVKMVHNGIEYGMMQAYAEGFSIMHAKTPLNLDLSQISKIWQKGSVVRSWLLDLTADALSKNPTLKGLKAFVPDSGEGRWTVIGGDRSEYFCAGNYGVADSPAAVARREQLYRSHDLDYARRIRWS